MTTHDLILYLVSSLLFGYVAGFLTVKINHGLVILLGKLWSTGNAQRRYILVGGIVTVIYGVTIFYQTNNSVLALIFTSVFAVLFLVGIKHAMHRFHQYEPILKASIQSLFPKEDPDDDNHDDLLDDTLKISLEMLESMRKSQLESLKILFVFFDSIFGGFLIFLISRKIQKFKFRRFISLSKENQVEYMTICANSKYGTLISTALKAFIGYNYYTSHFSWDKIGYNGKVLRRSFIN